MKTILEEALDITNNARRTEYGSVKDSFRNIAIVASVFTGKPLTMVDIAKVMISVKISREANKHKRDSLTDLCGYARLLSILEGDEDENESSAVSTSTPSTSKE